MRNRSSSKIRYSIAAKLIIMVGLVQLIALSLWSYFNIDYQKKRLTENILIGTDRLNNTILNGTQYAMMLNSRDNIIQIIDNIAKQSEIKNIRIYNKEGQIKFSNNRAEVDQMTNIEAEACYICHRSDPPLERLPLEKRIRYFGSDEDYRLLGIITPIRNDPGCSIGSCHFHPKGKKILGALDVVVSLEQTDREIQRAETRMVAFTAFVFLATSSIIFFVLMRFVSHPIKKLIQGTRRIAHGEYRTRINLQRRDEMGMVAEAINRMGTEIDKQRSELNKQRDEYQNLFESVPCLITVQDRNYRLLRYNKEFERRFAPSENDFCYHAYKGRDQRCDPCPVEQTFSDGLSHHAEESGTNKDGTQYYWIVRTQPIRDDNGNIVAAMEISHDITERVETEQQLIQASKMATLGEMATGIAHELNQPLSVIKTTSSLFLRKLDRTETIDMEVFGSMLGKVDRNVDRATRIINHMRQFARKTDLEFSPIKINDVLHAAFEIFSQQLKVRGIDVKWSLTDPLPKVKVDPQRLEQVFINLLINARDAIEEKWQQEGKSKSEDYIAIYTETTNNRVVCRICDSGIGVPDVLYEKIFEPFFTTKEVGKGTGLGLSISYSIIKDCRGSIGVMPNKPEGTCFNITLPIAEDMSGNKNGNA
jgi:C4-dicarboxylate-specific signal transduction histidine kinase